MESLDFPWDKSYREGWQKRLEAEQSFLPPDVCLNSKPIWQRMLERSETTRAAARGRKPWPDKIKTFIPGKVFFPLHIQSTLTKKEQAICVKVLQLYQSGANLEQLDEIGRSEVAVYRSLQNKIQEENVKFLEHVKTDWRVRQNRATSIKPDLHTYARRLWIMKLKQALSYAQFYVPFNVLPLTVQDDDPPVCVTHLENILQLGTVARLSRPTLLLKHTFKVHTLPSETDELSYNYKLPVSQDEHVKTLVESHDVDVVVSSSSLKRLLDDGDFESMWDMPFITKKCTIKKADESVITKNVVYIDKPLPKRNPEKTDFNKQCYKRFVRTNMCRYPQIVHPNAQTPIKIPNDETSTKDYKLKSNTVWADSSKKYYKTQGFPQSEEEKENVIHHNVTYSIWNIKLANEQNVLMKNKKQSKAMNFLVRCKTDACERQENNRPVVVTPKMEFQLEYGASIVTKSEVIRQWADLFFRPYSHLYRVRLQPSTSEVVVVESVDMQKINSEAMLHHQYKPNLRLGVLHTIFSILTTFEPGNYLLHHTEKLGPFVEVLKECPYGDTFKKDIFDLHKEYSQENCKVVSLDKPWCPIDVHYVLPVHKTYKRMPGMFKPLITPFVKPKKRKKAKAAKKKAKLKKDASAKAKAKTATKVANK